MRDDISITYAHWHHAAVFQDEWNLEAASLQAARVFVDRSCILLKRVLTTMQISLQKIYKYLIAYDLLLFPSTLKICELISFPDYTTRKFYFTTLSDYYYIRCSNFFLNRIYGRVLVCLFTHGLYIVHTEIPKRLIIMNGGSTF